MQVSTVKNHMEPKSLSLLSNLVGQTLECVSGPHVVKVQAGGDNKTLMGDFVLLNTTNGSLKFSGVERVLDFQGFEDEFLLLDVSSTPLNEVSKYAVSGQNFYFLKGQEISAVSIISEVLDCSQHGVHKWTYSTDIAVLIHLQGSAVSISKDNHNFGAVKVTYFDKYEPGTLPFVGGRFREDIHQVISRERFQLDVKDLIEDSEEGFR